MFYFRRNILVPLKKKNPAAFHLEIILGISTVNLARFLHEDLYTQEAEDKNNAVSIYLWISEAPILLNVIIQIKNKANRGIIWSFLSSSWNDPFHQVENRLGKQDIFPILMILLLFDTNPFIKSRIREALFAKTTAKY